MTLSLLWLSSRSPLRCFLLDPFSIPILFWGLMSKGDSAWCTHMLPPFSCRLDCPVHSISHEGQRATSCKSARLSSCRLCLGCCTALVLSPCSACHSPIISCGSPCPWCRTAPKGSFCSRLWLFSEGGEGMDIRFYISDFSCCCDNMEQCLSQFLLTSGWLFLPQLISSE